MRFPFVGAEKHTLRSDLSYYGQMLHQKQQMHAFYGLNGIGLVVSMCLSSSDPRQIICP